MLKGIEMCLLNYQKNIFDFFAFIYYTHGNFHFITYRLLLYYTIRI